MGFCSKTPYSHSRALELQRRRERENKTLVLRVYFCSHCGYWHLTSKEDRFKSKREG